MQKYRFLFRSLLLVISLLVFQGVSSQIFINEFSASNSGSIVDPDFGESADWVELYNAGDAPINLKGCFLTDNLDNVGKWRILVDHVLNPDDYVLIWCDGRDTLLHANFKLSADGEQLGLFSPEGAMIDTLSYPAQESNISMGRVCDGCTDWVYYTESSPGTTNTGMNYEGLVKTVPYFYPLGGIFDQAVTVSLKNLFEGEVRYTLDGSEPTDSSQLYQSPITIDKHTVLRARIFNGVNLKPGKTVTHSYFVQSHESVGKLPVISISSHPDNFWDAGKGIYVQDFKPDWEIPINIELFENDGSDRAAFNLGAGTKVNGLYSWQLPQKMLGIYFRKMYGSGKLDYPLFHDRKARTYDSFALRASGSDWAYTLFRDGMMQLSTQVNMQTETQGFRPCVVYINGQYMGIHNIRSKVDADFIVNEQFDEDVKIDMIENEGAVEEGSLDAYQSFNQLYKQDLTQQAAFDSVAARMDINNFTNYMIAELYGGNTSVGHNVMAWKPRDFGKWRWILVDLDRTMFDPKSNTTNFFLGKTTYPFPELMKNDGYKEQFGNRLADQLYTTFNPIRMSAYIDSFAQNIREELPKHILRWQGTSSSYGNPIASMVYWENRLAKMKIFAIQRNRVLLTEWLNFGFSGLTNLSLVSYPAGAGYITLNDLFVPLQEITGLYPANKTISLKAVPKPGYSFRGWKLLTDTTLIPKRSLWRYYDRGSLPDNSWKTLVFDDSSWSTGEGELGYGDGDERTTIGYGTSSSSKYPTYFFRKSFTLASTEGIHALRTSMKVDDGAVIYLNGMEVARINMDAGEVTYSTLASDNVPAGNSFNELNLNTNLLVSGENLIAVEVHQSSRSSSDVSFEMELLCSMEPSAILHTASNIETTLDSMQSWMAVYEDTIGSCVLPEVIDQNLHLSSDCSPYLTRGNVRVNAGATLSIDPGVEILFAQDASLLIEGSLQAVGTKEAPIRFLPNTAHGAYRWGAVILHNSTDTCRLSHMIIEGASSGRQPITQNAAISLFNSTAILDHMHITKVFANPISARYSDLTVTNSELHSEITGDLINVKYGRGRIENCLFIGNIMEDTDAIDYDDVSDSYIRNCLIRDFHGYNSDGIDIGEQAQNVLIEGVTIYNITDKGISVGQQSSLHVRNSLIMNCNLGVAAKDSSNVHLEHITFYGCQVAVANYEKNPGSAGGNTIVDKSVFANAYVNSYQVDAASRLSIFESISDTDSLPADAQNIWGDPMFEMPYNYNFALKAASPARSSDGSPWGANIAAPTGLPGMITISGIYTGSSILEDPEFIVLTNPGDAPIEMANMVISNGVEFEFPSDTQLEAGEQIIVTNNALNEYWSNKQNYPLYQWTTGRLDNAGETLALSTVTGIILDQVRYSPTQPWPNYQLNGTWMLRLKDMQLANHLGQNWELIGKNDFFITSSTDTLVKNIQFYPNPAIDRITVLLESEQSENMLIYNIHGQLMNSVVLSNGLNEVSLNLPVGLYIIKLGNNSSKLQIIR